MPFIVEKKEKIQLNYFKKLTFYTHIHDYVELFWVKKGRTLFSVDGEDFIVKSGDIGISFPNQVHSYQDLEPTEGIICIFSHKSFEDLLAVFRENLPQCPVVFAKQVDPQLPELFMRALESDQIEAPFSDAMRKGYVSVILGKILPTISLRPINMDDSNTLQSILRYCGEHYGQDINLEKMAADLHISKYHISHLFGERIHLSFPDYINMLRMQDACMRIDAGESITDAAEEAGFLSIRSFNRVFKKNKGMTPVQYRKRAKEVLGD